MLHFCILTWDRTAKAIKLLAKSWKSGVQFPDETRIFSSPPLCPDKRCSPSSLKPNGHKELSSMTEREADYSELFNTEI